MPQDPPDQPLMIRCPSCGQRFQVAESFHGLMVECGECEAHFEVSDDVIVRGRKYYPGERRDPLLKQVPRADARLAPSTADGASDATSYQATPEIAVGVSPLRLIMGLAGAFSVTITAVVLKYGASRGGVLDGVPTEKRLVMAAFVAFVSGVLIMLANPKRRLIAGLAVCAIAAGLMAMPMFFRDAAEPLGSVSSSEDWTTPMLEIQPDLIEPEDRLRTPEDWREFIGLQPLDAELRKLNEEGSPLTAVGVWLRNLEYRNWLLVRDFLLRETQADLRSHDFPRGNNSRLYVLTGIEGSIDDVAAIVEELGVVKNIHRELHVIEVYIDNNRFLTGPIEKLTDTSNPEFYLLNKIELESIDLDRVKNAVKRLADVEPRLFRADVSKRLIELLGSDWVDFKSDVSRALMVWAEYPGPAGEMALKQIQQRIEADLDVPEHMVALAVHEKTPGVADALKSMWQRSPGIYERYYMDLGPVAEASVLAMFDESSGIYRLSVLRMLERIGGAASLEKIAPMEQQSLDAETTVLVRNALRSIRLRLQR